MISFLSEVVFLPDSIQGEMDIDLEKDPHNLHLAGPHLEYPFLITSGDLPNMQP
jgi:hypothetical protein